jgi:hypothetical protein
MHGKWHHPSIHSSVRPSKGERQREADGSRRAGTSVWCPAKIRQYGDVAAHTLTRLGLELENTGMYDRLLLKKKQITSFDYYRV